MDDKQRRKVENSVKRWFSQTAKRDLYNRTGEGIFHFDTNKKPLPEVAVFSSPYRAMRAVFGILAYEEYVRDTVGLVGSPAHTLHEFLSEEDYQYLKDKIDVYSTSPHGKTVRRLSYDFYSRPPYHFGKSSTVSLTAHEEKNFNRAVQQIVTIRRALRDDTRMRLKKEGFSVNRGTLATAWTSDLGYRLPGVFTTGVNPKTSAANIFDVRNNIVGSSYGFTWVFEKLIITCATDNEIKFDPRRRLHNAQGPVIRFGDQCVYALQGLIIDPKYFEGQPTPEEILAAPNAEIRRALVDKFGADYIIKQSGELLDESEYGKLWRKRMKRDEDICMLEVVNSSPEPDGTYKTYWLRVPPNTTTAQSAVAWTFGVAPSRYVPQIET